MKNNLEACDKATKELTDAGYKMIATAVENGRCRHIFRNGLLWAVSDMSGDRRSGITESDARAYFNGTFAESNKTQLEDLDSTLKKIEDDLKSLTKRLLTTISDALARKADQL